MGLIVCYFLNKFEHLIGVPQCVVSSIVWQVYDDIVQIDQNIFMKNHPWITS